jgi:predicted O-methyltransferase YrrM
MPSTLKRRLKNQTKRLLRSLFEAGQRLNLDILPRHFYSEIPDIRALKNTTHWRAARSMFGVRGDLDAQVNWVDQCTRNYRGSIRHFSIHQAAVQMNGADEGYGAVEADFLYCFVRAHRPSRIIQIGCGVSTAVCLLAAKDEGYNPRITCIEPYPTEFLKRESAGGRIELIAKKVQDLDVGFADSLRAGDLFFVDSSHTLAPAGEVNLLILEVLPRIAAGVLVHFHDIYFPFDYGIDTLSSALFFNHETALLYAFLVMNDQYEIAASLSMLHHKRLDHLRGFFPDMQPQEFDEGLAKAAGHYPSSIFLRRMG